MEKLYLANKQYSYKIHFTLRRIGRYKGVGILGRNTQSEDGYYSKYKLYYTNSQLTLSA